MGKIIIIRASGEIEEKESDDATLEVVQNAVAGYIEVVPYFDTYKDEKCQAWCNEEGKLHGFPDNNLATKLWYKASPMMRGKNYLVGDIVILTGSAMLD